MMKYNTWVTQNPWNSNTLLPVQINEQFLNLLVIMVPSVAASLKKVHVVHWMERWYLTMEWKVPGAGSLYICGHKKVE